MCNFGFLIKFLVVLVGNEDSIDLTPDSGLADIFIDKMEKRMVQHRNKLHEILVKFAELYLLIFLFLICFYDNQYLYTTKLFS